MTTKLRLHHRIVLPFVLVAVVGAATAAYAALSVTTEALGSHVRGQLLNAAAQISRREFALNPAILRTVRGLTGAEVLTYLADGTLLASTLDEGPSRNALLARVAVPTVTADVLRTSGDVVRELPGEPSVVVYRRVSGPPDTVVAVIGQMTMADAATDAVERTILLSAAASLLLLILVSQLVARSVTAPIERLVAFTRDAALDGAVQRAEAGPDEIGRLAGSFNDMLDRLSRSREALVRSEKLALAGLLAARVAHDIRNPLSSIKMQTQLLRSRPVHAVDDGSMLTSILDGIEQVEAVVRDLLQLARPGDLRLAAMSLHDVVDGALQQIAPQCAHRRIAIAKGYGASIPFVDLDPERFGLALLNVLANAADAMPRGGVILVATRLEDDSSKVILEVCDDGVGLDPTVASRLFDPFVSTKRDGVGLGLVNAKAVVESHGGTIAIANRSPQGVCVTIRLPRSQAASLTDRADG